jgi:tetratricopeptide (TPR) repeat protein
MKSININTKTATKVLLTLSFALITISVNCQESEHLKQLSYKAYLTNSIEVWKTIENKAQEHWENDHSDLQRLFDLTEIQYGLLNACIANQNEEVFKNYVEETKNNVDTLLKYNPEWSSAHALKAGILSTEMAFSPSKGMFLGPKSNSHIEKAIKYDETEPRGWIQRGGSKLHTPKMFGGSTKEAVENYQKAVNLYEQDSTHCKNNWQYINAKAWLGIAYMKTEKYEKALKTFQSALEFEPSFDWVKYELMPNLKKKINE